MKVEVDYRVALQAIDKLENNKSLDKEEQDAVLTILKAVQGDYIPTKEELELQEQNIRRLDTLNPDSTSWDIVMKQCTAFESKYC